MWISWSRRSVDWIRLELEIQRECRRLQTAAADLDDELRSALDAIPAERRVLVSCEGAFTYLARDYGLDEAYLWPVNAESQVTPKRMARLINTVRDRQIPAIFCESTVSDKAQRQVAAESGARFGGTFYVDYSRQRKDPLPPCWSCSVTTWPC